MADSKITALTSIGASTDPANDPLVLVDVSDTSMAATGTTKKVTLNQLLGASGTATLASATISGDLTVDTSTLKVDSANNRVGIGTATPAVDLHIQSAGSASAEVRLASATRSYNIGSTGSGYGSANNLIIYDLTGAAERYRLDASGNHFWNNVGGVAGTAMTLNSTGLGVGVTPSGGNRLMIQNTTDCTVVFKSSGANVNSAIDYVSTYGNHTIRKSGTAVWDFGVINDASATPAFKVSNASAVGVQLVSGATSWTTLSDETMKDIIEPISNAVSKVGSLRSVIGKFKTDDSSKRRSFLIAQDVQSVLPEAVDVIGENNELGLRYTEVIPLLVAAIKELTARVQTLETR